MDNGQWPMGGLEMGVGRKGGAGTARQNSDGGENAVKRFCGRDGWGLTGGGGGE